MLTVAAVETATPITCDLTAIAATEREAHRARAKHLLGVAYQERTALLDGYAWRFESDYYHELCRFIDNERRCCAFLTFTLEVHPHQEPIWLRMTGSPEAQAALLAGINDL